MARVDCNVGMVVVVGVVVRGGDIEEAEEVVVRSLVRFVVVLVPPSGIPI